MKIRRAWEVETDDPDNGLRAGDQVIECQNGHVYVRRVSRLPGFPSSTALRQLTPDQMARGESFLVYLALHEYLIVAGDEE